MGRVISETLGETFDGGRTFDELNMDSSAVPCTGGAYVVLRTSAETPTFLDQSSGGHFKGEDPTVAVAVLEEKWVPGAQVVYIGNSGDLRRRIGAYCAFGAGRPVGHWGGRYIWQLADCGDLRVVWRRCVEGQTPDELEALLIGRFKERNGRLPFANISDPSGRKTGPKTPLGGDRATSDDTRVESPIGHSDVTTIMSLLGDIKTDVREIRALLEDEDGGEEEEIPEADC